MTNAHGLSGPHPPDDIMRHRSRSITWHGHSFRFERLRAEAPVEALLWAVSRNGEFIGTMPCAPEVSTREFDVRGTRWLEELLPEGVPTRRPSDPGLGGGSPRP